MILDRADKAIRIRQIEASDQQVVRIALLAARSIQAKELIAVVEADETSSLTNRLQDWVWSDGLKTMYKYVPELSAGELFQLPPIPLTGNTQSLGVMIRLWQPLADESEFSVSELFPQVFSVRDASVPAVLESLG